VPHRVDARQLRTRARPRPLRRSHGWPCLRGEQGKEAHGGTRPRVLVGFDKGGGVSGFACASAGAELWRPGTGRPGGEGEGGGGAAAARAFDPARGGVAALGSSETVTEERVARSAACARVFVTAPRVVSGEPATLAGGG
jgi:hypothetical protein